jgi:hypothetical protein
MTELYNELLNRNIEFMDDESNVVLHFYSTDRKFIVSSDHTNWIDINITHINNKSKYTKMADVKNDYYQGNINEGELKNSMCVLFKLVVKEGCISSIIRKYILMIIDNPEFNEDYSENSRYILVLYGIDRIGTMGVKLRVLETFKSSI